MASKTIVEAWYDNHAELEQRRLDDGRLEFEVTMRIVNQCIAAMQLHQARVLDIGGGPGRYGKPCLHKCHE
jgi:S-adenosylmethionine-dependent methyltransferase